MGHKKTILISPLDWGLGHATRIVPIINFLIDNQYKVIIAGSGNSFEYLKNEFPMLQSLTLPGINIRYSKKKSQILSLLVQLPKFLFNILAEHKSLTRLTKNHSVDIIISDNRYGMWNKKLYNIFITHQLNIKLPKSIRFLEGIIHKLNYSLIRRFDICLIPDFQDKLNLSGELSHPVPKKINALYIGPVSRFLNMPAKKQKEHDIDFLGIISGPEKQKSIFRSKMEGFFSAANKNTMLIPNDTSQIAGSDELSELIFKSKIIISRAGFTSVMDYIALNKDAILVPTPGQTEQIYLAKYLSDIKLFKRMNQDEIDSITVNKIKINTDKTVRLKLQDEMKKENYKRILLNVLNTLET